MGNKKQEGLIVTENDYRCYACDHYVKAGKSPRIVWTSDGQLQWVGYCCYKKISKAKKKGYQPPLGGPRLFIFNPEYQPARS